MSVWVPLLLSCVRQSPIPPRARWFTKRTQHMVVLWLPFNPCKKTESKMTKEKDTWGEGQENPGTSFQGSSASSCSGPAEFPSNNSQCVGAVASQAMWPSASQVIYWGLIMEVASASHRLPEGKQMFSVHHIVQLRPGEPFLPVHVVVRTLPKVQVSRCQPRACFANMQVTGLPVHNWMAHVDA